MTNKETVVVLYNLPLTVKLETIHTVTLSYFFNEGYESSGSLASKGAKINGIVGVF